jgi:hypothetical protein
MVDILFMPKKCESRVSQLQRLKKQAARENEYC